MKTRLISVLPALLLALGCEAFPDPLPKDAATDGFSARDRPSAQDLGADVAQVDASGPDACVSTHEVCNGRDDDCDGQIDEGFIGLGEPCSERFGVCRAEGVVACDDSGHSFCDAPFGEPTVERCDGLDDDCNGAVDDGLGVGTVCEIIDGLNPDCVTVGQIVCDPQRPSEQLFCDAPPTDPDHDGVGCEADCAPDDPEVSPRATEICNLIDDDCDGEVDEGLDCDCWAIELPSHRYLVCPSGRTWAQSVALCEEHRSRVAVFDSQQEERWVLGMTQSMGPWWIGLRLLEGEYRWVDGSRPNYEPWTPGEPGWSGRRPCVQTVGLWTDWTCTRHAGVLCEDVCAEGEDQDQDGVGRCDGDCDDSNGQVSPNEVEQCGNNRDDDCDGLVDEGCHG